ncbi:phosphoribosyltransferase [Nitriliruptoraceae bacterium ZYF776]|nr:phosphoribosyltransferase [Profundirhabdus halotolerans]
MGEEREILTWATYGVAARELASQVVDDGYRPDIVLSIARGGLVVAASLAYALSVKPCFVLNVEYYTDVEQRRDEPVVLPPSLDLDEARGARVLIADDVADTGHTLELVHRLCADRVAETRTAVLYEKPASVIRCDYVWKRTDRWILFPWSSEPPLVPAAVAER